MTWRALTDDEKLSHIACLNKTRHDMQLEARKPRSTKPRKCRLKTTFKSKELQELFNSLPPEMQRLVS
ncbi:hypothetical protein LCGC14_2262200 [marine sediment metagenome]|uniref:Uncharacterized protein n=1 Tax=marine sediment metagenome TaxID=412755 RepID=A0A0F9DLT3_9ZZZZ